MSDRISFKIQLSSRELVGGEVVAKVWRVGEQLFCLIVIPISFADRPPEIVNYIQNFVAAAKSWCDDNPDKCLKRGYHVIGLIDNP